MEGNNAIEHTNGNNAIIFYEIGDILRARPTENNKAGDWHWAVVIYLKEDDNYNRTYISRYIPCSHIPIVRTISAWIILLKVQLGIIKAE